MAEDNFSARYDLDRINGIFSRPAISSLDNLTLTKYWYLIPLKVVLLQAGCLHEMKSRGISPKAILFNTANTILAQGAALADLPMCDRFEDAM